MDILGIHVYRIALYYTHVVFWNVYFVGHTIFFIKGSVSHCFMRMSRYIIFHFWPTIFFS